MHADGTNPEKPLSGSSSARLEERYEAACRSGGEIDLAALVAELSPAERSEAFRLLFHRELDRLAEHGVPVQEESIVRRYPAFLEEVQAVLAERGSTNAPAPDLSTVAYPDLGAPEDAALPAGELVGRYRIVNQVGEGGTARVYRALDTELDRYVALKVPRGRTSQAPDRFPEEAKTVARLRHPGIVPVYDVGRLPDGRTWIVMEFVDGPSLEVELARGNVTLEQALAWVLEITDAVRYAHEQGYLHRDLKPANVLLDHGRARVTDFGLALHESDLWSRGNEFAGTISYMAPEQFRGEWHTCDGRTDIWALGLILYRLVTGRHAVSSLATRDILERRDRRLIKPPRQIRSDLPAALERIILTCLAPRMEDRYSSAAALRDDIQQFMQQRAVREPPPAPARVQAGSTRGWMLIGGGGLVLVAVLVLAVASGSLPLRREATSSPEREAIEPELLGAVNASPGTAGESTTGPPPPATTGAPVGEVTAELDVLVWNTGNLDRRGVSIHDRGVLPLIAGDQLRVRADLSQPLFLYVLWIDTRGNAQPLYPWRPANWSERAGDEKPIARLQLPVELDAGWPALGPPGMETLVLLGRSQPLPSALDLPSLLQPLRSADVLHPDGLLVFHDGRPVLAGAKRLRGGVFDTPQRLEDPLFDTQRLIAERLRPHFALIHALSFANAVSGEEHVP